MSQSKTSNSNGRAVARAIFDKMVLSRFQGAIAPTYDFLATCFDENMSAGETAALWNNRMR